VRRMRRGSERYGLLNEISIKSKHINNFEMEAMIGPKGQRRRKEFASALCGHRHAISVYEDDRQCDGLWSEGKGYIPESVLEHLVAGRTLNTLCGEQCTTNICSALNSCPFNGWASTSSWIDFDIAIRDCGPVEVTWNA
jgi:hypothetical protein